VAGRKPTVSDERFLQVLSDSTLPVFSTTEVAEAVGFSTNKGAYNRLLDLQKRGLVASKMIGRTRAWWLTDAGRAHLEKAD
jgi:predicted ArsR family transcriptional regulator